MARRRDRDNTPRQEPIVDRTLVIPGADECIIGTFRRCGQMTVVAYDYTKLLAHYQRLGMSLGDARDYIAIRLEGNWLGAGTPAIVHNEEEDENDAE